VIQDQFFTTSQAVKKPNSNINLEEDEEALLEEESLLSQELKLIQEKHKDVRLVYEKVTENIKSMCKLDLKNENISHNNSININNSTDIFNINNSSNYDLENSINKYNNQSAYDDELVRNFSDYLEQTRKNIESSFLSCGKEQFIKMMNERGEKVDNTVALPKGKNTKNRIMNKKNEKNVGKKNSMGETLQQSTNYVTGYNEYDYSDEEIKEDDKKVKEEYDQIVNNYKKRVIGF